jgi:nitrous oxidase accessory protein NosD
MAGYRNGALMRWKTEGMTIDARWTTNASGSVKRIVWLDAGTRALTAGPGSRVTLWDADAGAAVIEITSLPSRPEDIAVLTSSQGRRAVAVACAGHAVVVYGLDADNMGTRIASLDLGVTHAGAISLATEAGSSVLWIGTSAGPILKYAVTLPAGKPGG